jgi:hypothetical protein
MKILRPALLLLLGLVPLVACRGSAPVPSSPPVRVESVQRFDHSAFTAVLARYVNAQGLVDYAGLKRDAALDAYLAQLAAADPSRLSRDAQLAFWINAYNAGTMKLIVDRYPVSSILRITPNRMGVAIPGTSQMPFKIRFLRVAGALRTLDEIEHEIIRPRFREPRVHAALVCAAVSCPPLRREAYTPERLDAQLDAQMRTWLQDRTKNRIPETGERIAVSKIFDWFKDDFGGSDAAVQRYIARYFEGDVKQRLETAGYRITHLRYSWDLNDQGRR